MDYSKLEFLAINCSFTHLPGAVTLCFYKHTVVEGTLLLGKNLCFLFLNHAKMFSVKNLNKKIS